MRVLKPVSLLAYDRKGGAEGFRSMGEIDAFLKKAKRKLKDLSSRANSLIGVQVAASRRTKSKKVGGEAVVVDHVLVPSPGKTPSTSGAPKITRKEKDELESTLGLVREIQEVMGGLESALFLVKSAGIESLSEEETGRSVKELSGMLKRYGQILDSVREKHQAFFAGKVPVRFSDLVEEYGKMLGEEFVYDARKDSRFISFWKKEDKSSGIYFHHYMQMRWMGRDLDAKQTEQAVLVLTYSVNDRTGEQDSVGVHVSERWLLPSDMSPMRRSVPADAADLMEETKAQFDGLGMRIPLQGSPAIDAARFSALPGWKDWTTKVHVTGDGKLRVVVRDSYVGERTLARLMQDVGALTRTVYPMYAVRAVPESRKAVAFEFSPQRKGKYADMQDLLDDLAVKFGLTDKEKEVLGRKLRDTRHLVQVDGRPAGRRRGSGRKTEPRANRTQAQPKAKPERNTEPRGASERKPRTDRSGKQGGWDWDQYKF